MATPNIDPLDAAENPEIRLPEFWGQVQLDSWFCILQKGVGKVPFDPQQHSIDKRNTAVDINILPLAEQNISFPVTRGMIAESKEWAGTVLPTIKALGLTVRELNGKWVHAKTKGLGSTYTNKNGDVKERSTLEFVKLFASQTECLADFQSNGMHAADDTEVPFDTTPAPAPAIGGDDKERKTALEFLKMYVGNACNTHTGDLNAIQAKLTTDIAGAPMISKYYSISSPETMQLIMAGMSK